MAKEVVCKKCNKYLGEIRDGRLHKDIVYLCKNCNIQREALEMKYQNKSIPSGFEDIFKGFY
jgi:RNase P subunit RPR2